MRKLPMRKLIAAIVVLALGAGGYLWYVRNIEAPRTLRVAVEGADPPFNYVDQDGKLAGFDVDIADALCARLRHAMRAHPAELGRHGAGPAAGKIRRHRLFHGHHRRPQARHGFRRPLLRLDPGPLRRPQGTRRRGNARRARGQAVGVQRATIQEKLLRVHFPDVVPALYDSQAEVESGSRGGEHRSRLRRPGELRLGLSQVRCWARDLPSSARPSPIRPSRAQGAGIALRLGGCGP